MRQRRLEHYFNTPRTVHRPSGCNFLHLPYPVRKRIYELAGIGQAHVDLNYTNLKVYPKSAYPETQDCRKLDAKRTYHLRKIDVDAQDEVWEIDNEASDVKAYGRSVWGGKYGKRQSLLLASKKIHQEVEALIYADATFRVCLGHPLGFTRLWHLSNNALSHLGLLTIRLDAPKTVVRGKGWYHSRRPNEYVDLSTMTGQSIFKDWISTLDCLTQSVTPGRLKLYLIFCAKTMDDATAIVEPMMRLPRLKDCGLCVELHGSDCWWPVGEEHKFYGWSRVRPTNEDTAISRLASRVVKKLTLSQDQDTAPFRYLDLPSEIRLAILMYTELVSSHAVQWRPHERMDISLHGLCVFCTYYNDTGVPDDELGPCSCHYTTYPNRDRIRTVFCCNACGPKDVSRICYCSSRGSVWSSSCQCQNTHRSLFSVSHKVRQDAISVYYSCNKIVVTPYNSTALQDMEPYDDSWPPLGIPSLKKIELSLYLSSIARNALQHIRWLEWMLPTSQQDYLAPKTPAWFDYLDTLLLMENAMTVTALTFTIDISASGLYEPYHDYPQHPMRLDEKAWRWYETIVLPVRRLGEAGLKDFFVHLRQHDIEDGRRAHHERDLERAVMGKKYNSAERGKPTERMLSMYREFEIRKHEEQAAYEREQNNVL